MLGFGFGLADVAVRRGGGGGPPALTPYVHNFKPTNTAKIRAALAGMRAGTKRPKILFVGDSTLANGSQAPNRLNSVPMQTAAKLRARGMLASYYNWFGANQYTTTAEYTAYNGAVIFSGTWLNAGSDSHGGRPWASNTNGAVLRWAPEGVVNKIKVWFWQNTTLGTFNYNINGGALVGPIDCAGAAGHQSIEITVPRGAGNFIRIVNVSGTIAISGMAAWDDTELGLDVLNLGWRTSTANMWNVTANPWSPLNAIGMHQPDLTIFNPGINHWRNNVLADASFKANYQPLITKALETGDVVIQVPIPSSTDSAAGAGNYASTAVQQSFIEDMYELSAANDNPIYDETERFGSYAAAEAAGYTQDSLHYNSTGYGFNAEDPTSLILRAEFAA